jgi:hypothetical protein
MTGPVTDNDVGRRYIKQQLGITALNALQQSTALVNEVVQALPDSAFPEEIEATAAAAPPPSDEELAVAP